MYQLLLMNFLFTIMFLFMMHPLSMGMMLFLQTIIIALITGFLNSNFWYSYILFLIMIGGMLILFIYMTSIASNEKFKFSNKLMLFMIMLLIISFIIYMNMDTFLVSLNNYSMMINKNSNFLSMSKFFNTPSNIIMFIMIIYLFITLIAVVKITNFKMGPLRQKF
uniref:NADH-ubiquinone oxidoreductase chain 6 n=1 Tax=Meropathus sp. BMNH 675618 TaxID=1903800 RepID=A0A343A3N1_9COLE|nr:NADH dehydrogenase subunit 6 [Meropathus sp. BMNH 675618]